MRGVVYEDTHKNGLFELDVAVVAPAACGFEGKNREREKTLIFYKPLNNEFLFFLQLMMKVDKVSLLQNTKIAFFKDTVFKFKSSAMIF